MPSMLSAADGPREIRAAVLALKQVDKGLRREINARMRETMNPVWKRALSEGVSWAPEQVILKGARIAAGNPPSFVTASSTRKWRAGSTLVPRTHWHAFEYGGGGQGRFKKYERTSPLGKVHTVRRRTRAHLKPRRKSGYVIGPAVAAVAPRMASLFVQSVVRSVFEALEKGR